MDCFYQLRKGGWYNGGGGLYAQVHESKSGARGPNRTFEVRLNQTFGRSLEQRVFSILLGSPSTYINYKFVFFHYLGILDNIYIYIYIVYMVSVDVRLFILHLDF